MKFYVRRSSKQNPAGYSYVGPLAEAQAKREAQAWRDVGEVCMVQEATPEVRQHVRRWEKVTHADDAREKVTFRGEAMTMAAYRLAYESD